MKIQKLFLLGMFFISAPLLAQVKISGTVTDKKGTSIPGANVYIKDTFDGTISAPDGTFSFETGESGQQILVVSFIGYKTLEQEITLNGNVNGLELVLVEEINKLDGVTITAGAYEASDVKKVTVLKPLDIVTTASAAGDIFGAVNTLPGTSTVGESGRLFVRGGDSYETKVFIDGLEVRNAFGATAPNVPTRGRFSPFLFKGTVFSTGGYSAEYGQALSSALVLNSNDLADKTQADISLMSVGGDVAYVKKWENTSLSGKVQYTDLRPYQDLIRQRFDWEEAPVGTVGEIVFRQKLNKDGLLKVYANTDFSGFIIRQPNIDNGGIKDTIDLSNDYYYLNTSYKDILNEKWTLRAGVSVTSNEENILLNTDDIDEREKAYHAKVAFNVDAAEKVSLNFGTEYFHKNYRRKFDFEGGDNGDFDFTDNLSAAFIEGDYFASNAFVLRAGLRLENSSLLGNTWLSPRVSMAYKLNELSQFSLAYGKFLQASQNEYALVNNNLKPEKATHYILNYQYINQGRIFRIEGYYKDYDDLVKFTSENDFNPANYFNTGFGEAKGFDIFWRDNQTIKGMDYWVSYSYVDAERDYLDFAETATPRFASRHNFSWVIKQFITPIRTQVGATYTFASGRPFNNPNLTGFQNDKTMSFHDLSLNAAVLLKQNIILYMSSSNVFGRENIFGYQYASQPNGQGVYERQAIRQGAKRFLFLGLFITLSKDGKENQLENL